MRTRIASLVFGSITLLAVAVAPVAADTGPVTIESDVKFQSGIEKFTSTGAFCDAGVAVSTASEMSVDGEGNAVFDVAKTFKCRAGTGSLFIELTAVYNPDTGGTAGTWTVTGGTGAWQGASGGGTIEGTGTRKGIYDTYTGTISVP